MSTEDLKTTSYALLALLAVRPWTTYELAKQMERSLNDVWPRAESVVYQEPKRLVAHGLAKATKEYTGRRARTVYAITPKGRRALRAWLSKPGAGPTVEFEAMIKVMFGDLGTVDQLGANLEAIRDIATTHLDIVDERLSEYAATGGPHPDRLPVIALAARFHREQAEALHRWVEWAIRAIEGWDGVTPAEGAKVPEDAFEPTNRLPRTSRRQATQPGSR